MQWPRPVRPWLFSDVCSRVHLVQSLFRDLLQRRFVRKSKTTCLVSFWRCSFKQLAVSYMSSPAKTHAYVLMDQPHFSGSVHHIGHPKFTLLVEGFVGVVVVQAALPSPLPCLVYFPPARTHTPRTDMTSFRYRTETRAYPIWLLPGRVKGTWGPPSLGPCHQPNE